MFDTLVFLTKRRLPPIETYHKELLQCTSHDKSPSSPIKTAFNHLREFKGAVALSNAGVTLLQHKAYQSAQQTMQAALSLMRVIFNHNENNESNETESKLQATK